MKFNLSIAGFLVGAALAGFVSDADCQDSGMSPVTVEYPSVDARFLSPRWSVG